VLGQASSNICVRAASDVGRGSQMKSPGGNWDI
jgi:hypothetical protein